MPAPDLTAVKTYLGADTGWSDDEISSALAAETAAQARVLRIPESWPADLAEALCRRVARNLAMRQMPLGSSASISEVGFGVHRPGMDIEVRRLEAPYRRLVVA